jgi:hypothetical protein
MEGFKPNKTEPEPNSIEADISVAEAKLKAQSAGLSNDVVTALSKNIQLDSIENNHSNLLPKIQAMVSAPGAALASLQAYAAYTAVQIGDAGMALQAARDGVNTVLVTAALFTIYSVYANVFKNRAKREVLNS